MLVSLEEPERRTILCAMRESNGDKLVAARVLGIGKTTLYRKLRLLYESYSVAQAQAHPAPVPPRRLRTPGSRS
ncbi:MAG: helix-turn-helix domain-containing protein [Candidatus Acidiferrales bacterium]